MYLDKMYIPKNCSLAFYIYMNIEKCLHVKLRIRFVFKLGTWPRKCSFNIIPVQFAYRSPSNQGGH